MKKITVYSLFNFFLKLIILILIQYGLFCVEIELPLYVPFVIFAFTEK